MYDTKGSNFYSCIRNYKSYSIVKEKNLINTWMKHYIFASMGRVKLFLLFLQEVRNFSNKSQCSGYTFTALGDQEEFFPSWLHYLLMRQKPAKRKKKSSGLGLGRTFFEYWLWYRHFLSGKPFSVSEKQASSASQQAVINSLILERHAVFISGQVPKDTLG